MPAWRGREKTLTREEAIAMAKKEAASSWYGSPPLFAAYPMGGKIQAFPLDPIFEKQNWLVVVKDLSHPSAMLDLQILQEFHHRYGDYGLGIILVLEPHYSYFRDREYLEWLSRKGKLSFPLVVDRDGKLAQAFGSSEQIATYGVGSSTRAVLLAQKEHLAQESGVNWFIATEKAIQNLLRKKDPGLPLPPLFEASEAFFKEIDRIDFGRLAKPIDLNRDFKLEGIWWSEGDRLVTTDARASVRFKSPASRLALFARSISKTSNVAKVAIDLAGTRAPLTLAGPDLINDEDGGALVRVDEARLYQPLVGLPVPMREVTLRFPYADRAGVAIYGIAFWD